MNRQIMAAAVLALAMAVACADDGPEIPGAPTADAQRYAGDAPLAAAGAPVFGPVDAARDVTPPHHGHRHDDLDGHFHRTLIYGDGFQQYDPASDDYFDCTEDDRDATGARVRCIDHRYWLSDLQSNPETLRVVVDTATVWRQTENYQEYRNGLVPDSQCRVSDLRTQRGHRFVDSIARDTGKYIREATGRTWLGSTHYRRPGAWSHPNTVVLRFVVDGCGGENAAACAVIGPPWSSWGLSDEDGGRINIVIDDGCRSMNHSRIAMDELYAHELGHVLGFYHPENAADADEMSVGGYNGYAGFSRREQIHMRHAYAHGRGWRGNDGRHLEGPRRTRRPVWIVD